VRNWLMGMISATTVPAKKTATENKNKNILFNEKSFLVTFSNLE